MKYVVSILTVFVIFLYPVTDSLAAGGNGTFKLGYTYLDEMGNESVAYRSFNEYEGVGLSFEGFKYRFDNGMRATADLRNISLNNRHLRFGFNKPGLFGVRITNSQYRREYDFKGGDFTRRHRTGADAWYFPHQHIRFSAGIINVGRSGQAQRLFEIIPDNGAAEAVVHDYQQLVYHGGVRLANRGSMFQVEYRGTNYRDDEDPLRDQTRTRIRVNALLPIPQYEYIVVHGGYQRFETEYDATNFGIVSNTGWAGVSVKLPKGFQVKYNVIFNRAGSDSNLVKTDNLANAAYVSYTRPGWGGGTVGYQHDLNDDLTKEVRSNSIYVAGWVSATDRLTVRGDFGNRDEKVRSGSRLTGDEDRNRLKFSARYRLTDLGILKARFENMKRKNDQIGSEVDFQRVTFDASVTDDRYGTLTGGYAYSTGDYNNIDDDLRFEFQDHLIYGDIITREYRNIMAGFGATYYRSKRDLDVESFTLRFSGDYRFMNVHHLLVVYHVHNFDDYLIADQYYTANTVEVSLTKDITF